MAREDVQVGAQDIFSLARSLHILLPAPSLITMSQCRTLLHLSRHSQASGLLIMATQEHHPKGDS